MTENIVLEVKNLKKHFGAVKAVDGISFAIEAGEIFGFLGPNGAGKTTTIRILMDFIRPTSGEAKILGKDANLNSAELKNDIGYLPGNVRLYDNWSGQEHINFVKSFGGKTEVANELKKQLNFDSKPKFHHLSTGNKQKLGLILALMKAPKLLILDEPTVSLDPLLQNDVQEILIQEAKRGTTIFISSHNLSEVDRICTRVGIIKEGKMIASEGIQNLKDKRIHQIAVYFSTGVAISDFKLPGVDKIEEVKGGLIIRSHGDINPILKVIAKYQIRDIEITHATLEETFLEFYQK